MKFTWNTGRLYQADGQIIEAELDRSRGVIRFTAKSRMVKGEIVCDGWHDMIQTESDLKSAVMAMYDSGRYVNGHPTI
jgi:hypothetical protein